MNVATWPDVPMHRSARPSEAGFTRASGLARPSSTTRDTVPARPSERALAHPPMCGGSFSIDRKKNIFVAQRDV